MGLAGLATALDLILRNNIKLDYSNYNAWWISIPFMCVSTIIILLITFKHILHPKVLFFDAKNTLSSSFLPTYSMTIMCIGGFLAGWQHNIGKNSPLQIIGAILMCIGVLIQFFFIYMFLVYVLKNIVDILIQCMEVDLFQQ